MPQVDFTNAGRCPLALGASWAVVCCRARLIRVPFSRIPGDVVPSFIGRINSVPAEAVGTSRCQSIATIDRYVRLHRQWHWPYKKEIYQGRYGYADIAMLPNGKIAYLFEKDAEEDLGFTMLPAPPWSRRPNRRGDDGRRSERSER